jgi:Mg-chelatase subunit ChlD
MNQDLTDITIVLDRSGSMRSVKDDTIGGYNTFLKTQRDAKVGACRVSLVQFDDRYEMVYPPRLVAEAPELTDETFVPRGWTALLDAIGKTIVDTGERYKAMPKSERPGKVLFVIITDGGENSSTEYNREQVFKMIAEQRNAWKWDFIFLGANQDAIQAGASLGLSFGKSMNYASNAMGTSAAFASVGSYAVRSRGMGDAVAAASNAFLDEDRKAQADAGAQP